MSVRCVVEGFDGGTTWDDAPIQLSVDGRGILSHLGRRLFRMRGTITCKLSLLSLSARPHHQFLGRHESHLPRAARVSLGHLFPYPCLWDALRRLNYRRGDAQGGTQQVRP